MLRIQYVLELRIQYVLRLQVNSVKRITAHEVALAGIATAIATIFLAVGNFTSILLFVGYLVASIALSLPLAKDSYRGYALAYVSTVLLTLLLVGTAGYIVDLLPFVLFFGLHPLMCELQLRFHFPKLIAMLIKAVWFDFALWLFWGLIVQTTGVTWIDTYAVPIILGLGTLFFVVYEVGYFRIREKVFALVKRISK